MTDFSSSDKFAVAIRQGREFWWPIHRTGSYAHQFCSDWESQWDAGELAKRRAQDTHHVGGFNVMQSLIETLENIVYRAPMGARVAPVNNAIEDIHAQYAIATIQAQIEENPEMAGTDVSKILNAVRDHTLASTLNDLIQDIENKSGMSKVLHDIVRTFLTRGYAFLTYKSVACKYNHMKREVRVASPIDAAACYIDPVGFLENDWDKASWCFMLEAMNVATAMEELGLSGEDITNLVNHREYASYLTSENLPKLNHVRDWHAAGVTNNNNKLNVNAYIPVSRMYWKEKQKCTWVHTQAGKSFRVWHKFMKFDERDKRSGFSIHYKNQVKVLMQELAAEQPYMVESEDERIVWGLFTTHNNTKMTDTYAWPGDMLPVVAIMPTKLYRLKIPTATGHAPYKTDSVLVDTVKPPLFDAYQPQKALNVQLSLRQDALDAASRSVIPIGTSQMNNETKKAIADPDTRAIPYNDIQNPNQPRAEFPANPPIIQMQMPETTLAEIYRIAGIPQESVGSASQYQSGRALQQITEGFAGSHNGMILQIQSSLRYATRVLVNLASYVYDDAQIARLKSDAQDGINIAISGINTEMIDQTVVDLEALNNDLRVELRYLEHTKLDEIKNIMAMVMTNKTGLPPEVHTLMLKEMLAAIPSDVTQSASTGLLGVIPQSMLSPEEQQVREILQGQEQPSAEEKMAQLEAESKIKTQEMQVLREQLKTLTETVKSISSIATAEGVPRATRNKALQVVENTGEAV